MPPYAVLRFFLFPWVKRHLAGVEGLENIPTDRPFIIAANHLDFLDPLYFLFHITALTKRGVTIISKTKNYYWLRDLTLAIDPLERPKVLEKAKEYLKRGRIICIFPEGERNPAPRLLRGKTGTARLALFTKAPVVPIGLSGPSGRSFLESAKLLFWNRQPVTVRIGLPLYFPETENQTATSELLEVMTRRIMRGIAVLAQKEYHY